MKRLLRVVICLVSISPLSGMRSSDIAKKYGFEIATLRGVLVQFKQIQAMIFVPQATTFNRDMHARVAFATGQLRAATQAYSFLSRADGYVQERGACFLDLYSRFLRLDEQQSNGEWLRKSYSLPELIALLKRAINEKDASLLARIRFGISRSPSPLPFVHEPEAGLLGLAAEQLVAVRSEIRLASSAIVHVDIPGEQAAYRAIGVNTEMSIPEHVRTAQRRGAAKTAETQTIAAVSQTNRRWLSVGAAAVGLAFVAICVACARTDDGANIDVYWLPLLY